MRFGILPVLLFGATSAWAANDVSFLTVTSRDGGNTVEWLNPPSAVGFTRVIGRTDTFAADPLDFTGSDFMVDDLGAPGEHRSIPHAGLTAGSTIYYAAFVHDGSSFSSGVQARARVVDDALGVAWAFHIGTGTTSMAPPGLGANVLVASNDGSLLAMERGPNGGVWPSTWTPFSTNQPIQHRPPVIPLSNVLDADNFTLVGSQDGYVRAVDAETGDLVWSSKPLGMVQAAPAASFLAFGGPKLDFVLFGSRNAGQDNLFLGIKAEDGGDDWTFENDDGGAGLGIVSGGASVDYAREQVYFGSRERVPGAETVFALRVEDGEWVWRRALGNVSTSPILRGGVLYVGTDDGMIYALDAVTGGDVVPPVDTEDGAVKGFVFPDFAGSRLYFSTTNGVHCFEDTGSALERCWMLSLDAPSTPVYPPGSAYLWVGSGDGALHQIEVFTGSTTTDPVSKSLPLGDSVAGIGAPSLDIAHGLLYVGSEDGVVYAVPAPY